ncbi:MAG: signal peptidase I [Anaerolineae bacterium]|nr:signal peptidase I [Anaerolineae bacterium]
MAWPPGPWEHLPGYVPQTAAAVPAVVTTTAPGAVAPLPGVEEWPPPARRWEQAGHIAREVAETLILTFAIFFLIRIPFQNFRIEGFSMEPTLHTGQYIIVNRALYRWFSPPQRGDIIVLRPPNNLDRDYIKRIIGLPGETVEVRQGRVFINNAPLEEKYIQRPGSYTKPPTTLGPKEYFVLGDNRDNSNDSHTWGPLPEDLIEGKAWVTYWPPQDWGMVPNFSFASGP